MEVMITLAIVAILAAIAYPSYLAYAQRSDRSDATTTLFDDAQSLQRCYSQTFDYTKCLAGNATAPPGVTQLSPTSPSPQGYYSISVQTPAADQYTITATPARSPQTSDAQCQRFTLQSSGAQGSTGSASSQTCWGSN
jgi:type IV pilus assembly protein PilE